MNDIEKLAAMRAKVIGKANDEAAAYAKDAYERKEEALALRRRQADVRIKAAYTSRRNDAERERSAARSRAALERSKTYLALRDEITDKVLEKTGTLVRQFADSDAYDDYMCTLCARVSGVFDEPFTLLIKESDMRLRDALRASAGDKCLDVIPDGSVEVGGAKFRAASGSVTVNETLEENLEHSRADLMLLMGKYLRTED